MEQIHTSDSASRNYSWLSIMDKVCTLTTTCLETCILWPYGDLRFFRRPLWSHLKLYDKFSSNNAY